jgi:ribosomal protein S18 acetylase RimI-like enzyme
MNLVHNNVIPMIKRATADDLAALVRLCAQHAAFEGSPFDSRNKEEQLFKLLFGPNPVIHCRIAHVQGLVVGYTTFMREVSTWEANFYVHMDCLFVQEAYRGLGIGKLLMEEVVKYAIAEKCKVIQWQTPQSNERALKFYHRLGAESKPKFRLFLFESAQLKLLQPLQHE